MEPQQPRPTWLQIVGAMIVTGFAVGLLLGLLESWLGFGGGTAGVGAAIGVVGGLLLARRVRSTSP